MPIIYCSAKIKLKKHSTFLNICLGPWNLRGHISCCFPHLCVFIFPHRICVAARRSRRHHRRSTSVKLIPRKLMALSKTFNISYRLLIKNSPFLITCRKAFSLLAHTIVSPIQCNDNGVSHTCKGLPSRLLAPSLSGTNAYDFIEDCNYIVAEVF